MLCLVYTSCVNNEFIYDLILVPVRYVESLKKRGKAEELASVDVIAGLDLLANRGQWAKCLQTAQQEVRLFEKNYCL